MPLFLSTRRLVLITIGALVHPQLALPAGCDLPMFAGPRLFGSAASGNIEYVATGDFNHDGFLDVVTSEPNKTVSVLLGNGDRTFHGSLSLGAFGTLGPVAVADLNGDANLDLVFTASNTTGTAVSLQPGNVSVMLGHGDGTFAAAVNYSIGKIATSVAIGDLNGDGKPDLAVADDGPGAGDVSVLLGNGDGTFQAATRYPMSTGQGLAPGILIADLNGDGNLDVAVTGATLVPNAQFVYYNGGHRSVVAGGG